jgi:hypothetical protein
MMLIKLDNGVWWEEKMALFVLINQAINNPPYLRSPSYIVEVLRGHQNKLIHAAFDSDFLAYQCEDLSFYKIIIFGLN